MKMRENSSEETKTRSGLSEFFKSDPSLGVSKFRFYLLRTFYIIIILFLGIEVWTEIITHKEIWKPLSAVAYSFWGAFTLLSILGIFHPLKMIPLLLVQFFYKLIWLIIAALPLWTANQLTDSSSYELATVNTIGIVIDILVIPWSYVFKNYILTKKSKNNSL
ncbi:MAG: hypothetical protein R3A12_12220 [Ignavibacteria bacterium]|nr:hypothetical protein [Ignavibacteriota bacterium]